MSRFGADWDVVMGDDYYGSVGASPEDVLDMLAVSGAYDIVGGAGNSEIIGAAARDPRAGAAAQRASAVKAMQAARAMDPRAIAVRQQALSKRRRFPLGFVPTSVAGGGATTATIPAAPQNLYRPERVTIPSDIAFDFGVQDLKVGNNSQLVSGGEVPGAIFTEVSVDNEVTFDTAEVGNQITILVRNTNAAALTFRGALMGTVASA